MQIQKIFRNYLPYKFVKLWFNNKYYMPFVEEYQALTGKDISLPDEASKFKTIISVQGFGYSGSGAVIDLLREYRNIYVDGMVEQGSSMASTSDNGQEFTLIHSNGGLFEIEQHIEDGSIPLNDLILNRFIRNITNNDIYENPDTRELIVKFFANIVEFAMLTDQSIINLDYQNKIERQLNIFTKKLSVSEYRKICNHLLTSLFNRRYRTDKDILVLDQLFAESFDMKKNLEYVPNLKCINVFRDPRDVYAYAVENDIKWLWHNNIDIFVKRMINKYSLFDRNSSEYLSVRFEELVNNYDSEVSKIENYLSIKSEDHYRKYYGFNPSYSCKNIGLWKSSSLPKSDFDYIKNELSDFCYE